MGKLAMPPSEPEHAGLRRLGSWWSLRGEAMTLTALALLAFATLPLLLLGLLSAQYAGQVLIMLGWAAGSLLLLRLPGLLRLPRRRTLLLAVLGLSALAGGLFARPDRPTLAGQLPMPEAQMSGLAPGTLTFKSPPRISKQTFAALLAMGHGAGPSPAAPLAEEIYDIIVSYEVDPAVALAFFARESQFCTTGMCLSQDMKTWGHLRRAYRPERGAGTLFNSTGPFVKYATWQDSIRDWCELMLYGYVAKGLDTVDKAVPVYAPSSDNNDPPEYIDSVYRMVAMWTGGRFIPPRPRENTYDGTIEEALIVETFLAGDLGYHPEWAFHSYMLEAAKQGSPIGSPLGPSSIINVGGQRYAIQTFAMDTLFTPLASNEDETDWNDVKRLSELLRPPSEQR